MERFSQTGRVVDVSRAMKNIRVSKNRYVRAGHLLTYKKVQQMAV